MIVDHGGCVVGLTLHHYRNRQLFGGVEFGLQESQLKGSRCICLGCTGNPTAMPVTHQAERININNTAERLLPRSVLPKLSPEGGVPAH